VINEELINQAKAAAMAAKLDPILVCAVVDQESGWNPLCIRYEPAFHRAYIVKLNMPATEDIARAISWGLMQVMGETARELGFKGAFLSELSDPVTGLAWGCAKLARCLKITGNVKAALSSYNGGSNKQYADQVLARRAKFAPPPATLAPQTQTKEE
jgi:soluble lytic murein transglycosylase-like protein